MKQFRALTAFALFAAATLVFAQSPAQKTFDQLQTLQGNWSGTNSQGTPVSVTFRETSGGSALMSEIQAHGPESMVSMFHLDNDRLMMTHYCAMGNQPRMVAAVSPDGKTFKFTYLDATNLATPDAGHMQDAIFTLVDADHHTEEWIFNDHGKQHKELFQLARTK